MLLFPLNHLIAIPIPPAIQKLTMKFPKEITNLTSQPMTDEPIGSWNESKNNNNTNRIGRITISYLIV